MLLPNDEPVVVLPAGTAVAHSPTEPQKQVRRRGISTWNAARQLATALFCAGALAIDVGIWKMFPSGQEKHAAEEVMASTEEAAITRIAQSSLANSKHPLLVTQAREARFKIEQAEARMQATVQELHELRTKRMRLIYLFCGAGTLLIALGALVRLSA